MPFATIYDAGVCITVHAAADTKKPFAVEIQINDECNRITELRDMLFRAANTLDPQSTPAWVTDLLDVLDGVPR